MSTIHITYLNGCPYCKKALETLETNNIKHIVKYISHNETEAYKTQYKFPSFPHITLKNNNTDKIIYTIGGCDDLHKLMEDFHKKTLDKSMVMKYMTKYKTSKRNILKTIKKINNIT